MEHIGKKEAGKGGYNAVYHGSRVAPPKPVSTMTFAEAAKFQNDMIAAKSKSSAIGKFQFIRKTFNYVSKALGFKPTDKFNAAAQEQMALYLMKIRGLDRYISGELSAEDFANNLAKEWASMPVVKEIKDHRGTHKVGRSYYAGDGLNKSLTSARTFLTLVKELAGKAQKSNIKTKSDKLV